MNRPLASADRMALATNSTSELPVAIIGGGPVGLAAAVHLIGHGLDPVILEAGSQVGAAVRDWGHVPMFSPWGYSTDRAAVALLQRHGWSAPEATGYPTGMDLAERYLDPLAATPEIASRLRLGAKVTGISRAGVGKVRTAGREDRPFEVRYVDSAGQEGRIFARAVIDASGTWSSPNPAGAGGLPAIGERAAASRIRYGMPDVLGRERQRYAGRRILVVGSGHSATGTLLDLAELAREVPETHVTWAFRTTDRSRLFGGGEADRLPRRGALGTRLRALADAGAFEMLSPFSVDTIESAHDGSLCVLGDQDGTLRDIEVDEMVVATGLRPDLSILGELRIDLDPALDCARALAPLIDPNEHSCGTVRPHGAIELAQPEPGLFVIGMKAYGRAPTFLLATGHEQARSVAAYLAGDLVAAGRVELDLPETGVCNGPGRKVTAEEQLAASSCCGAAPEPQTSASSCCR
jgi:thioredoxin reductase